MENTPFLLNPNQRWQIIAQDGTNWRVGIYNPEYTNADEITQYERHTCPELFICVGGRCGLLILMDTYEKELILYPQQAIVVTHYHNGFKVDKEGFFIVVEQIDFETEFLPRNKV